MAELTLYENIERLGTHAFSNCTGLHEVTLPVEFCNTVNAFEGCESVEVIHYKKGKTGIMPDLKNLPIQSKIECSSGETLHSVDFEEGIINIGSYCFAYCHALKNVDLPDSLESIGGCAFYETTSLDSLTFHKTSALSNVAADAFTDCPDLTMIGYTDSYIQSYAYSHGIPFICLDAEKLPADFVLPSSLTMIEDEAFTGCVFTAVKVPTGCESIGALAFSNCKNLVQIEIPESVTEIAEDAFKDSDSVIIFCQVGSAAETFAKKHGVVYVIE